MLHHAFAHYWVLYGLLTLPVLGLLALRARRRRRKVFAQLGHWPSVQALVASQRRFRWLRHISLTLGLICLAGASAGPQWGRDWQQATAPGRDLVVVLDVSRSMQAEQPSRLQHARDALDDLLAALRRRGGNRVALVVFAGRAKVLCPLTHDYDHVQEILENLDANQLAAELPASGNPPSGTRIGLGLVEAVKMQESGSRGFQDILLLSDGDDPEAGVKEWLSGVNAAHDAGIPVHVVGVGDPEADYSIPFPKGHPALDGPKVMSRMQDEPLREIARLTGGFYEPAHTEVCHLGTRYLDEIKSGAAREDTADALPIYQQRSIWFFAAALLLVTMEMILASWRANPAVEAVPIGADV